MLLSSVRRGIAFAQEKISPSSIQDKDYIYIGAFAATYCHEAIEDMGYRVRSSGSGMRRTGRCPALPGGFYREALKRVTGTFFPEILP